MSIDVEILAGALAIFALRVFGIGLGTVRMLILMQGRKLQSSLLGFVESLVFVVALGSVVTELDSAVNVIAYCGGFAVGNYVGMWLETRLVPNNYVRINIISAGKSHDVAQAIRGIGHGVTEGMGQGARGEVGILYVVVRRQDMPKIIKLVSQHDPTAFVTVDPTRAIIQHGYIAGRPLG